MRKESGQVKTSAQLSLNPTSPSLKSRTTERLSEGTVASRAGQRSLILRPHLPLLIKTPGWVTESSQPRSEVNLPKDLKVRRLNLQKIGQTEAYRGITVKISRLHKVI